MVRAAVVAYLWGHTFVLVGPDLGTCSYRSFLSAVLVCCCYDYSLLVERRSCWFCGRGLILPLILFV
jgi:hypothetical protein